MAASDSRRRKLATIREDVIALVTDMKYGEAIRHYEEVLGLVQEERLVEHLGDHYEGPWPGSTWPSATGAVQRSTPA